MENMLKSLFEYQKFEQNERLAKLIAETDARQVAEISDDDLAFVAAAGDVFAPNASDEAPDEVYDGSL